MEESFETPDMKEQLEKIAERIEKSGEEHSSPRWTFQLSVSTAVTAVLAAIASLQSGALSNQALLLKNEAILAQAQASDHWSHYQAKGLKAAVLAAELDLLPKSATAERDRALREVTRYKEDQRTISAAAKAQETRVEHSTEQSEKRLEQHHRFAISVALFQISIALAAIAALIRRKGLWHVGLAISVGALVFFIVGFIS